MTSRDDGASEIALIMENVISDVVAANNCSNNVPIIDASNNANRAIFDCSVPNCGYVTQGCGSETIARDLLSLHMDNLHKGQSRSDKNEHINKINVPEKLDLDPTENCDAEFKFWWTQFSNYLLECDTVHPVEKRGKLINLLSFRIFQYVEDCYDFDSMKTVLEKLYVKKQNIFMARNKLLSCRQKVGENVQTFFQRIKNLAKFCCFGSFENRTEWECQSFLSGLRSRTMRLRIFEKEASDVSEVFWIAENFERSYKESLMFDVTKQDSGVVGVQKTSRSKRRLQGGIGTGNHPYEGPGHQHRQWYSREERGLKPAVWPCSSGHSGTDAPRANSNVPFFPKRRGKHRKGMKKSGAQFGI